MIVAVANIYLMANLSHPNDTNIGKSWAARIAVYIGLTLVCLPVIFVFLDVDANKHNAIYEVDHWKAMNGTDFTVDKVHHEF